MAKIYSEKIVTSIIMKPKQETIAFLLNYSKALKVFKSGKMVIETIAN